MLVRRCPHCREPDWNLVKRHYRRYGNPEATAANYGIDLETLQTRAIEEVSGLEVRLDLAREWTRFQPVRLQPPDNEVLAVSCRTPRPALGTFPGHSQWG